MTYDYQDADGYHRGDMGRGRPRVKRIYKLVRHDKRNKLMHMVSIDAFGIPHDEVFAEHTVELIPEGPITR